MNQIVFALYDRVTDIYDHIMLFPNFEIAFGTYRRMFRDMFVNGEINKDALRDYCIYGIANFDTKSGVFESIPRSEWLEINVLGLLSDLSDADKGV